MLVICNAPSGIWKAGALGSLRKDRSQCGCNVEANTQFEDARDDHADNVAFHQRGKQGNYEGDHCQIREQNDTVARQDDGKQDRDRDQHQRGRNGSRVTDQDG